MRKVINVITLTIMLSVNIMNPFIYALAEENVTPQDFSDTDLGEVGGNADEDTGDIDEDDGADEDSDEEDGDDEEGTVEYDVIEQEELVKETQQETSEEKILEAQEGNEIEKDESGGELPAGENQGQESVVQTEIHGGLDVDGDIESQGEFSGVNGYNNNQQPIIEQKEEIQGEEPGMFSAITETAEEIITAIKYFFVKSSEDYITYTQEEGEDVIILEDPWSSEKIIIMDRNLGAVSNDVDDEKSYGFYYQWGNNNGFEKVDETNVSSMMAVYTGKYEGVGYTRDNLFRVGNEDIWEEDENGYSSHDELWNIGEEEIQGPCPDGYHIPSKDEWNKLVSTWIKIHTVDEEGNIKSNSSVDGRIDSRLTECGTGNNEVNCIEESSISGLVELFMNELKLPKAGNYNANGEREENVGVYWTRTPGIDSYKSEVFSIGRLFGEEYSNVVGNRANGNSLRCFLNVKKDEKQESKIDVVLNALEITGTATYDNVTVNVIAPIGSFKEGTTLEIRAIENEVEVKNVEDTIVNKVDEIEKKPVFVAFDISFIDPDTKQEVQPLSGSVSVSFDYKANQSLMVDEEKNVSVYHINDKDENGEELKNEDEIKVDKVENIEIVDTGVIQTDVYNFSVYVLTLSENSGIVITLDPNGGTFVGNPNITVDEDGIGTIVSSGGFIQLPAVYKDGYYLEGWYNGENRVGGIFDEIEVSESITLSGIWEESDCFFSTGTVTIDGISGIQIKGFNGEPSEQCLENFVLPSSLGGKNVISLNQNAFKDKKALKGVLIIPDSVIEIGKWAFSFSFTGTNNHLYLGSNVKYIRDSALEYNQFGGNLSLPSSLKIIGDSAFKGNHFGGTLVFGSDLTKIGSSAFSNNYINADYNKNKFTSLNFDDAGSLTTIGSSAFHLLGTLKGSLIIPNSVIEIGDHAFSQSFNQNYSNTLVLGNNIKKIYGYAFELNNFVGEFVYPDSLETLGGQVFAKNNFSGELIVPGRFTTFSDDFYCNRFSSIVFSVGVKKINDSVFRNNNTICGKKTIQSVIFPENMSYIGRNSFEGQAIEGKLIIPESDSNLEIKNAAFYNNNITELEIRSEIKSIESYAFGNNKIAGNLYLPVEEIQMDSPNNPGQIGAFYNNKITSVKLGANTKKIGTGQVFQNNPIVYIDLQNAEFLGQNAFNGIIKYNGKGIKSVYIPDSVNYLGQNAITFYDGGNKYTVGYVTTKKDSLDYTGAYISPIIQLYTYTFVDEEGHILGTGYYPEIIPSDTTRLIGLDFYRGSGDVSDYPLVDSLIPHSEGEVVVRDVELSENSIVDENKIVTGVIRNTNTVTFVDSENGNSVKYVPNGSILDKPEDPESISHTFSGWYDNPGFEGDVFDFTLPITSDKILYAKWIKNFEDLELHFLNNERVESTITLMDRNLGATSNDISKTDSYGYYFKWGNNSGYKRNDLNIQNAAVGTWEEGEKGPCPTNYHIPTKAEFVTITSNWESSKQNLNSNERGKIISSDLLLPFAGSYWNNGYHDANSNGNYWASSKNSNLANILYLSNSDIYPEAGSPLESYGKTIRCVKDSTTHTLTIDYDGGKSAVIAIAGEKITTLDSPIKEGGYVFSGWYDIAGNKIEKGDSIPSSHRLYAKWLCDTGYVEEDGQCKRSYTITYDKGKNKGIIEIEEVEVISGSLIMLTGNGSKIATPKEGYEFIGWTDEENGTGVIDSYTVTEDVILYAVFSKTLTGTFNKDDSTVSSISDTTATCTLRNTASNCTLTAPTITCAAGYSSGAWSPLSMIISANTTFTASCSDAQKPVCSVSIQPTKSPISNQARYNQGTVTFTCTDNVGVSTANLSESNITYDNSVVTLSNFTAGGNATSKTFTFTYTAKAAGSTTFTLNAGAVSDAAGNSNAATSATNSVIVDTTAPTITITQENAGTWTKSKSVTASASDGTLTMKESTSSTCDSSVENFVTYADKNYISESDNGKYICYKAVDSVGNEAYESSAKVEKIDRTAPVLSGQTTFLSTWYTTPQTSTFTYTDTGAGINEGYNTAECTISNEGTASICQVTPNICDKVGNCNTTTQTSNSIKLDKTAPVFTGKTQFSTDWYNTDQTSYFTYEDTISGINGDSTTSCVINEEGTTATCTVENTNICNNAGLCNTTNQTSNSIKLDKTNPTCSITGNPTSPTNQNVELTLNYLVEANQISDGYSWNGESYSTTQKLTVSENGTYTGYVKDAAGNTGSCSVEVTMIDKVAPTITINNPSTTPAQSKTITATTDKGTLYMAQTDNDSDCKAGSSLEFVAYDSITFSSESDNGKYVCYKAVDTAGNEKYEISAQIEGIKEPSKSSESSSSSNYSGGGGRRTPAKTDTHGSAESGDKIDNVVDGDTGDIVGENKSEEENSQDKDTSFTQEQIDAYTWANENGITTKSTIESAKLNTDITREQLAKMMVVYMSKVLGKQPVINKTAKYQDVSEKSRGKEMYDYIQLAYQYQIMGINYKGNPIRYFNPSGKVTRAEFATVLSRVLYGSKYNQKGTKYYEKHMKALNEAGVLNNTNPELIEKRGYVMLMLMRSVK